MADPFADLDAVQQGSGVDPFADLDAADPFADLDAQSKPAVGGKPGVIREGMRSVASALSSYLFPYPQGEIAAPAGPQEPKALGSFVRGVANVEQAGRMALLNAGVLSPEVVAQQEQQAAARQAYYPAKPREERGLLEHIGTLTGENIPNAVVRGVASALGGIPALAAAGFGLEGASSLAQRMQERGVNLQDAEQIRAFMADPEAVADARRFAATRGGVVAGVDALSAGLARGAGRALFSSAGRGATGAVAGSLGAEGVELAGGGAGEALAQVATQGGVSDWNAVKDEVLGGVATGAATQAGLLTREGRAAAAQRLAPQGARVVTLPELTPEYLAGQQQFSNAGAAPGGVSPAADTPTAGSPEGAVPAPLTSVEQENLDYARSAGVIVPDGWIIESAGETGDAAGGITLRGLRPDGSSFYVGRAMPGENLVEASIRAINPALEASDMDAPAPAAVANVSSSPANVRSSSSDLSPAPAVESAAQGAPAAGEQAPQGRTARAADTGLTPMSRPAGASVPVSPDAEKQISEAISSRMGFPVRKGSSVDVLRRNRNNGAETLKAKIIGIVDENTVRVEYTGLTYAQKKLKLPTEVDVGVISEPANVAAMRRRARILGELPQEERRQVVADSRAFNDLLEQSPGLYDVQTAARLGDLPNPREAAMKRSQLRRDALAVAKRELGLPEDADMSNPVWQARALPVLREFTGQAAAAEVRAAPEVNEIGFQDIGHNDLVFAKGSWFRVELDGDGAIKSLKDGETIQLADVPWDTLNVSGRLSPGDTGYDQALTQYAQQTRPDAARAAEVVAQEPDVLAMENLTQEQLDAQRAEESRQAAGRAQREDIARRAAAPMQGRGRQESLDTPNLFDVNAVTQGQQDLFARGPKTGPSTKGNVKGSGWGTNTAAGAVEDLDAARAMLPPGQVPPAGSPRAQFSRLPFAMPEMLEFIRRTTGRNPKVMKNPGGKRLGFFRPDLEGGSGTIGMRASVYEVIDERERAAIMAEAVAQARATLEAESSAGVAQGLDPVSPDVIEARAQQEGVALYEALYKERLEIAKRTRGSAAALQVLAHEGPGHWGDYYPGDAGWARGNFFGRVMKLSRFMNSEMAEHPANLAQGFTKQDRRRFRAQAEARIGKKPTGDDARKAWGEQVSQEYQGILDAEAAARGLVRLKDVKAELEPLIAWWNGTPTIPDYFKSSEELYAETLSVFMLAPQQMLHRAPTTTALLYNWMSRNPEFKRTYEEFQTRMASGDFKADRVARWRERMRQADADSAMIEENTYGLSGREFWDSLVVFFDRKLGPVYARIRDLKAGNYPEWLRLRDVIKRSQYVGGEQKAIAASANAWVANELAPTGWTYEDFNEYRFHKRVVEERYNLANPGTDAKASFERLRDWQAEAGPDRWAALERASDGFTKLHMAALDNPSVVRALGAELHAKLKANPWYVTFAVTPEGSVPAPNSLEAMMRNTFGDGVGGGIYKQVGTHQNIRSPATATVQKWLSLTSWARREEAKREIGNHLISTGEALPVEYRWDGRKRVPVKKSNMRIATLTWIDNGEVKGAYVPRALAAGFEAGDAVELNRAMRILSMFNSLPKGLATRFNPLFWSYQVTRDLMDAARKTPGIGLGQLLRDMPDSLRSAYSAIHGVPDADAVKAMQRNVGIHSQDRVELTKNDLDFERLMKTWHLKPAEGLRGLTVAEPKVKAAMKRFWHNYANASEVLEHAVKISAMKQIDARMPDMPEEQKRYWLQTLSGSPDFLDKGLANPVADLGAMFFNAAKQSYRSEVEAFQVYRKEGKLPEYWQKMILHAVVPKLIMFGLAKGLAAGLFPGDEEDWKAWYASIPDQDKVNYLVLPVGYTNAKTKEVGYFRFPLSETQRLIGGVFWKFFASPDRPGPDAIGYAADSLPGPNPFLGAARAAIDYFVMGRNPDNGRGGSVVGQREFTERGSAARNQVLEHMLNNTLGIHPVGKLGSEMLQPARDDQRTDPGMTSALASLATAGLWGRWFKVSNGGLYDTAYAAMAKFGQEQARKHSVLREAAASGRPLSGEALRLVQGDKTLADYYRRQMREGSRARPSSVLDDVIGKANTKSEAQAIRDRLAAQGVR